MIGYIKKIAAFLSLALLYFIFREFLTLYIYLHAVHPYLGYVFLISSSAALVYFVVIPVYRILSMPRSPGPSKSEREFNAALPDRIAVLRRNPYLREIGYDLVSVPETRQEYDRAMSVLRKRSVEIRNAYVNRLFYSSAISQNGFIDAVLILSASVNLVRETFILYNGRVSNRDLWIIARQIYYSMAIGGSETVEYATGEMLSKLSTESMRSIPFFDRILGSLADGFVNACLLTRVAIITDNYCSMPVAVSDRDLRPSPSFIVSTAMGITGSVQQKLYEELKKIAGSKVRNLTGWAVNPVKRLFERAERN